VKPFNWVCPYCNHAAVINEYKCTENEFSFDLGNKYGWHRVNCIVVVCPNAECREVTFQVTLLHIEEPWRTKKWQWQLIPQSAAKDHHDCIPEPIIQDYEEARLIADKSPKASATLARRCLRGMIRNLWGVNGGNLLEEIQIIKEKVKPDVWEAIDSVRNVGNIGAHMEKDINMIIDADHGEAKRLIALIEMLMKEWYFAQRERQNHALETKEITDKRREAQEDG
jgi:hypothetical protein